MGRGRKLMIGVGVVLAIVAFAGIAYAAGRATADRSADGELGAVAAPPTPSTTGSVPTTAPPTTAPPTTAPPSTAAPNSAPATTASVPPPAPGATSAMQDAGTLYTFPIEPEGGASYARSHHDYPAADIFAECGSAILAPVDGTVQEVSRVDTWDASVNDPAVRGGLSFSIVGVDGVRYYGSHLQSIADGISAGSRVSSGQAVGAVGDTGNAAGTGCHLHFGISTPCGPGDHQRRRGEHYPQEFLDSWRSGGQLSPAPILAGRPC